MFDNGCNKNLVNSVYPVFIADIERMHVLLVDDAPELVMLFRILLEREQDITVTPIADDFESLYESVDWSSVTVAVVDRFLGSIEGGEILQWIEHNQPHVRRIMLTADDQIRAEEAHAELVLRKPIDVDKFINGIRGIQ